MFDKQIYIYIYREREVGREREGQRQIETAIKELIDWEKLRNEDMNNRCK